MNRSRIYFFTLLVASFVFPLHAATGNSGESAQTVGPPSGCAPLTGSVNNREPRGIAPGSANPLAGLRFYVDPEEPSVADYNRYLSTGNTADANLVNRLASRPKFKWTGRFTKPGAVRKYLGRVQCVQPGSVPEIVTLRHQGKESLHAVISNGGSSSLLVAATATAPRATMAVAPRAPASARAGTRRHLVGALAARAAGRCAAGGSVSRISSVTPA